MSSRFGMADLPLDLTGEGQPAGRDPVRELFQRALGQCLTRGAITSRVAGLDLAGRDIDPPPFSSTAAVADQLARRLPGSGETEAVNDVVQAPLEELQQFFAGRPLPASRPLQNIWRTAARRCRKSGALSAFRAAGSGTPRRASALCRAGPARRSAGVKAHFSV